MYAPVPDFRDDGKERMKCVLMFMVGLSDPLVPPYSIILFPFGSPPPRAEKR